MGKLLEFRQIKKGLSPQEQKHYQEWLKNLRQIKGM